MQYYFAPLEGVTDRIYRQLHSRYFPGVDRYYLPFLSPTVHRALTPREAVELPPADTLSYCAIPQLLTKNAEDFLWMAQQCADRGYSQVNLNLGCPSGTVTAKGKGAGMLRDLQALDSFLYEVYKAAPLPISVKTRIGFDDPGEFPAIMEIFNRYPICQLIIHPRVRTAFYKGAVHTQSFGYAAQIAKMPLCYNGDLWSKTHIQVVQSAFPEVKALMLGRGLVGNPAMLTGQADMAVFERFYAELFDAYAEGFGGARNAMFRLKEHWSYLMPHFDNEEKLAKRLRKTTDQAEYKAITREIFHTLTYHP